MKKIIIASNNAGKIAEFKAILAPLKIEVLSQSEAGVELVAEETGDTFEENARLKAAAVMEEIGMLGSGAAIIADDSGLCVDALGGNPGVQSANYDNEWLLEQLKGVPEGKRGAKFVCVLCIIDDKGAAFIREQCEGAITLAPKGDSGFGYDPVFLPKGDKKTFAEMKPSKKNAISHRGLALAKLTEGLV
ncbi:MAG: RdgB/HAM1 family non-canonical purine NTP pyrophosphatase [Oscillospiraceae bacterium]|nr:RdgB/HAM1 family non-canonical purine NTP pyrophosphatase [Oscillospiraceae bacterium]